MASSVGEIVAKDTVLIRSMRNISKLEIDFGMDCAESYTQLIELLDFPKLTTVLLFYLLDGNTRDGESLKQRMLRAALPTSLTSIELKCISLPSSDTLHLDEYHSLRHLKFQDCTNVGLILDNFRQPKLESLTLQFTCQLNDGRDEFLDVQNFLIRFRSLRSLTIGRPNDIEYNRIWACFASSIANHCESLRKLIINFRVEARLRKQFVKIPLRCNKLSQLVFPIGETSLSDQCQVR